ncbi:MAG: small multi-drug export protein [Pirellula sp.]|jgi:hypothetical protein|nr:small multi-drug export protein [Pirellula sp.]
MNAQNDIASPMPPEHPSGSPETSAWKADWYYRRENPISWWLSLAIPLVLTSGLLLYMALSKGLASVGQFFGTCMVIIFVLGKTIIAGGHIDEASEKIAFYSPGQLLAIVLYVDLCTTLLVVYHLGTILRLPLLGWLFDRLVTAATKLLLKYPQLRKLTYFGIAAFVAMPFASGPSGGILGRILGLDRRAVFLAAMTGTAIGSLMILFFSDLLFAILGPKNAFFMLLCVTGVLLVFFGVKWAVGKWKGASTSSNGAAKDS